MFNMARDAFQNVKTLVTNSAISISLRKTVLKTYIWSTVLYGCELRTLIKISEEKLEAVEMWFLRRMLKSS